MRIDELTQLACDHINPFTEAGFQIPDEVPVKDTTSDIPAIESQPKATTPPPSVAKVNFISFQVNPRVTYLTVDLFQVAEARDAWKTGTEKESELNGFLETLSDLRNQYQHIGNSAQRDELAHRIIEPERQTMVLRDETPDPDEVSYKVQQGSFTSAVPMRMQALFDKTGKIRTIETFVNEEGATVYTTGKMKTYADGLTLQNQVRVEGVKDAFVIAIKDGKRIPLPEAKILSGEE